jgi:hypothetical protein
VIDLHAIRTTQPEATITNAGPVRRIGGRLLRRR